MIQNMRKFIFASAIMTTVLAVQTPLALAGQGPPLVHIGNPHDFRPSCNAEPANPQAGGCGVGVTPVH